MRETLAHWGLDGSVNEAVDAVLVAGELLANAWQHGGGARTVELSWHGSWLRVAVSDGSPRRPRLLWPHRSERVTGYGLYLVDRLAGRWGAFALRDGKTVWADLRMPPPVSKPAHPDGSHP